MQTMAERFSWYTGETFEITGEKPVDERDTMVSTRILRPSGKPPILVDWRVRQGANGYLLIDILAEGSTGWPNTVSVRLPSSWMNARALSIAARGARIAIGIKEAASTARRVTVMARYPRP